jgi:transposase
MAEAVVCAAPESPRNDPKGLPDPENIANADPLPFPAPNLKARPHRGRLLRPEDAKGPFFTPEQRLLILDSWRRSAIPAGDFAPLVGVSRHTIYAWKKRFDREGPGGLVDHPRGTVKGSRLPDLTKRAILMLKESNPNYGCERISDLLARGPALQASATAVTKVLKEAGYVFDEIPTRSHPDHIREFERARPNQLWQTDLFTFILKRQNRRVYLVAFMDDHSRFIVSYGLHASQSAALVMEVLRAGISSYNPPEEILTDNGSQYITWRGKSAFAKELEKRGIRHVVSAPQHPQTLGKIERYWGTLWRECLESAIFLDLEDARRRIGLFTDHYNFSRPHRSLDGLVPADRFFGSAPEVLKTLRARVAANALELARNGIPKKPFYITGQVGGQPFSVHAEGERMIMTGPRGREEVDLAPPPQLVQGPEWPASLCPDGSPDPNAPDPDDAEDGTSEADQPAPPEDPKPENGGSR